ncbi:MAG: type II toxin-antitoxin system VapC family toxin [Spirochaetia bacterium]|nr:type II toxin-antitoxin system VapC family toxin [Spirochaetia bacterium]
MKILFDTHAFIWFLNGDKNFASETLSLIADKNNAVYISAASYWEICIKISIGKLSLAENWSRIISDQISLNRISWLDIKEEHLDASVSLPWHHRDPFDRLLAAQSLTEECLFCTSDEIFTSYGLEIIRC